MLRSRRRRNRATFAVALALLLVATSELSARMYLVLSAPGPEEPRYLQAEVSQIRARVGDDGIWMYEDFHGDYYNIDNGRRRTLGQPQRYDRTLWLFGNSGMFDPDVADGETSASQLQRLFNAYAYRVRVVNTAMSGINIRTEYQVLKKTPVAHGDLVLFVDGEMDVTRNSCDNHLALIQFVCQSLPNPIRYDNRSAYLQTVDQARDYALVRGAAFYHFVQPCAFWQSETPFGMPILVSADDFISSCHMAPHGNQIAARALFDALTLI